MKNEILSMEVSQTKILPLARTSFAKIVDFQKHFKIANRLQGKFHWSHIALVAKSEDSFSRLAVVASKKAVGKRAVLRNRAKRRLRPLMRKIASDWDPLNDRLCEFEISLHWVVRPKAIATQVTAKELENDVRQTFFQLLRQFQTRMSK